MNRAARSIRSGSSVKETSGDRGVRSTPAARSADAAERVDELRRLALGAGDAQRHRVHGEVAAGEVGLDLVGEGHVGLARVGRVGLGAVGGDLEHRVALLQADRAEPGALVPHRVGPAGHELGGALGAGVGGEVDVGGERPAEHGVADDAAHEVEAVTGRVEPLRQRAHLVEDRAQPLRDHPGRLRGARDRRGTVRASRRC